MNSLEYPSPFDTALLAPMVIFFLSFFLLSPSVAQSQLSFNFTSFSPNNHDMKYYGDAFPSDPVIQLTLNLNDKNMTSSTGRVTYTKQMQLWDKASGALADFSTRFSFIINSQGRTVHADGIAFFLAPDNFSMPNVKEGSGLGLVSGEQIQNSASNPFLAVEFDTFPNSWDPNSDHVGIDINSVISVKNTLWLSRVSSGQINQAWISYNSSSKNLSVVFTGFLDENVTIQQELFHIVDLSNYLPEWVSFGFSGATGSCFEIHTLHSWSFISKMHGSRNFTSEIDVPRPDSDRLKSIVVIVVAGPILGAFVAIIGLGLFVYRYTRNSKFLAEENKDRHFSLSHEFEGKIGPKKFSYKELAIATKDFSESEKLGQGGFGLVYRGFLKNLNSYVAVKKISKGSKQGVKEYASEVKTISRLRHRNLVQLIGWCHEERELLLVYEFMSNGSLDLHLFKERSVLKWVARYNIVKGLAAALLYLHEEWEQCVLHRDIKSSNVMLDSNLNAKLGDFGLARLIDHNKVSQTTVLAGTMGYMAPECFMSGKASKESDVFSFGTVALEIACGRKCIDCHVNEAEKVRLVELVWDSYGRGNILEAVDSRILEDFNEREAERVMVVGLWCAHPDHNLRPSIKQVVQVLSFEMNLPNLPLKMPVATYSSDLPMNMSEFWLTPSYIDQTDTSCSSSNSKSSKRSTFSAASSSSALHSFP